MENRDIVVSTRVTEKEFLRLKEEAEKNNRRVSDYIRFLILEKFKNLDNDDLDIDDIDYNDIEKLLDSDNDKTIFDIDDI